MKKTIISILLILLLLFAGCGRNEQTEDTSLTLPVSENTTVSESTTISEENISEAETAANKSSNSDTTTKPAEQKSAGQKTTKKVTATQKSTTTEDDWDCNVDGHSCKVGPIGWVNSFDEATDKALEYIASQDASGNFRVEQCLWCGKYTAEVTLR